jgi:hypothetical protein
MLFQMTGKDKDYRYMATSDLLSELNKESFKAEQDLEPKLTSTVLQQLEDASGDVSGLAVKWYAFRSYLLHSLNFLATIYYLITCTMHVKDIPGLSS